MYRDGPIGGERLAPHLVDDLLLGRDPAAMAHQVAQQAVFDGGQAQFGTGQPDPSGRVLDPWPAIVEIGPIGAASPGPRARARRTLASNTPSEKGLVR